MTKFWVNNPLDLLKIDFNSANGILNLITILIVLISIATVIYTNSSNTLSLGGLAIVFIVIFEKCFMKENFENLHTEFEPAVIEHTKSCKPTTQDNPFGNPLVTDFGVEQKYSGICDDSETNTVQNETLNDGIFMNSNDYVWRRNKQSQWYSIAGGTVPNDQTAFANWCYNDHNNCKSGNIFMKNPELAKDYLDTCKPDLALPQTIASGPSDYIYTYLYPQQGGASVFPK